MEQILKELEAKLKSALSALTGEVAGVRTNRPSPALVEDLKIDYLGQQLAIKQLGSISVLPPREMVISLWESSGATQVAKALEDSKRGFSVSVQGNAIRVSLPPLSAERREEMLKLLRTMVEKTKIQVRSSRDEANKKIEAGLKAKIITEDQKTRGKKKIQDATDKINGEVEALFKKKEKEISE